MATILLSWRSLWQTDNLWQFIGFFCDRRQFFPFSNLWNFQNNPCFSVAILRDVRNYVTCVILRVCRTILDNSRQFWQTKPINGHLYLTKQYPPSVPQHFYSTNHLTIPESSRPSAELTNHLTDWLNVPVYIYVTGVDSRPRGFKTSRQINKPLGQQERWIYMLYSVRWMCVGQTLITCAPPLCCVSLCRRLSWWFVAEWLYD